MEDMSDLVYSLPAIGILDYAKAAMEEHGVTGHTDSDMFDGIKIDPRHLAAMPAWPEGSEGTQALETKRPRAIEEEEEEGREGAMSTSPKRRKDSLCADDEVGHSGNTVDPTALSQDLTVLASSLVHPLDGLAAFPDVVHFYGIESIIELAQRSTFKVPVWINFDAASDCNQFYTDKR
jgi:hypothetical protein